MVVRLGSHAVIDVPAAIHVLPLAIGGLISRSNSRRFPLSARVYGTSTLLFRESAISNNSQLNEGAETAREAVRL